MYVVPFIIILLRYKHQVNNSGWASIPAYILANFLEY